MHEILYRAKRKDNRKWVEGYYVKHETRQVCAIGDVLRPEEIKHYIFFNSFSDWNMPREMKFVEVIPDTVGQYTGLTDKNGTRIFEGDILKYINEDNEPHYITVVFEDCAFLIDDCGFLDPDLLTSYVCLGLEVAGNIFENPVQSSQVSDDFYCGFGELKEHEKV